MIHAVVLWTLFNPIPQVATTVAKEPLVLVGGSCTVVKGGKCIRIRCKGKYCI